MKLSSDLTFLYKFILPGAMLGILCLFLPTAIREGGAAWMFVAPCIPVGICAVGWAWRIKLVSIKGEQFSISNFRSTHLVPISHLFYFEEDLANRCPSITLHFDPPTPYGKSIKLIPPRGSLMNRGAPLKEISNWLKEVLKSNNAEQPSLPCLES